MSGIGILTRECLSFPLFAEQVWEGLPQDIHQRSTQTQSSMIFFSQNDPDCCVTFVQICLWKSSEIGLSDDCSKSQKVKRLCGYFRCQREKPEKENRFERPFEKKPTKRKSADFYNKVLYEN